MKTVRVVAFLVGASFGVLSYAIPGVPTILKNTNKHVAQKSDLKNAFFAAAKQGNKKQIKVLLAESADVSWIYENGRTTLHWAALLGHEKVAKHLLKRKERHQVKSNNEGKKSRDRLEY